MAYGIDVTLVANQTAAQSQAATVNEGQPLTPAMIPVVNPLSSPTSQVMEQPRGSDIVGLGGTNTAVNQSQDLQRGNQMLLNER